MDSFGSQPVVLRLEVTHRLARELIYSRRRLKAGGLGIKRFKRSITSLRRSPFPSLCVCVCSYPLAKPPTYQRDDWESFQKVKYKSLMLFFFFFSKKLSLMCLKSVLWVELVKIEVYIYVQIPLRDVPLARQTE